MINTFDIYEELTTTVDEKTAKALTRILSRVYEDAKNTPSKQDFTRLEDVVYRLSETQLKTEERLDSLTGKIEELTEAQRETDKRIKELTEAQRETDKRIKELTEAQQETDKRIKELTEAQRETDKRIKELTEAQKKTEERLDSLTRKVEELTEAQKKTEERLDSLTRKVEELTEAQLKTEATLEKVIVRINTIEERLEGISNSVGYSLENSAYKSLPQLLEPLGIKVTDKMIRKYINGYQVNIFSKAEKDSKEVYIVGECKVRPSKKEIERFLKIVENIKDHTGDCEIVTVFVAHDYPPDIEQYIKAKGIIYFWSYEL